jgi:hypothetical protein
MDIGYAQAFCIHSANVQERIAKVGRAEETPHQVCLFRSRAKYLTTPKYLRTELRR